MSGSAAVVLLSGGMDSAVALYWAMSQGYDPIHAITFDYGQVAVDQEIRAAQAVWHASMGDPANHRIIKISMASRASILQSSGVEVDQYDSPDEAVERTASDKSYIPLRNAILVSLAAGYLLADHPEGGTVVMGIRARFDGPGGFPDCTPEFAVAMSAALSVAMGSMRGIVVQDPLNRYGGRDETLRLAVGLGCFPVLKHTVTCYKGTRCGKCLPCTRRQQAFEKLGLRDPAESPY